MYCVQCGTKNPDGAKFCYNCGTSMTGNGAGRATTTKKSNGNKGGFFSRLLISMVVFAVFYAGSYAITTLTNQNKADKKSESGIASSFTVPPVSINKESASTSAQTDSGYIANLDGFWEEVKLQDGSFNLNVSALTFHQTVYNCTGFTVNMDVTMNAGTNCKDWQVWGRSGNNYVKLAKIYLPAGDGYISQSVTFANPVTFDSIAVTPTINGSYSWSMALGISDIYTR